MIFDGGTAQADPEMIFTSTDGTTYTDIFQINGAVGTGVDIKSGGLRMGTTTVIDASRNITAVTGAFSGKVAVMSASVHGSYDFYNNGTFYNNGAAIIDDNLTISSGNLYIPEYIYHSGDTNTYIRFTGDAITLRAGGTDMINIIEGSDDYVEIAGRLQLRDSVDLKMFHSSTTTDSAIHMPRAGYISFYGDTNVHHCIRSANQSNSESDDIMISSYGALYIDLDSNNNNVSGADFVIGRHNSTSSNMFSVSGEDGDTIAAGDVTAFGSPSDIRLKENIEVIADPLNKVLKLKGVTFNYKDTGKKSTGLIAQDLEEVLPEVVYETHDINDDNNKFKAVRYGNTVGLLVEAIKEQQTIINRLEERIKKLEGEK